MDTETAGDNTETTRRTAAQPIMGDSSTLEGRLCPSLEEHSSFEGTDGENIICGCIEAVACLKFTLASSKLDVSAHNNVSPPLSHPNSTE